MGERFGWWLLALCAWLMACRPANSAENLIEESFQRDFHCGDPVIEQPLPNRYEVYGCGMEAVYECSGHSCSMHAMADDRIGPQASGRQPPPAPRTERDLDAASSTPLSFDIHVEKARGEALLVLDIRLDRSSLLHVTSVPDRKEDSLQLKVVRRQSSEANDDCALEFMIDGERLKTKTHTTRDGYMLSQRVLVGAGVMRQLREAEKIAFRACDQRWALMRWQVQLVHDYMDRFDQERDWKSAPKREAGMLEPSSGWPIWVVGGTPPSNVQATPLDGASLYKLLKVSIFQLEATRKDGMSQGSAVAVSPTELLTNCHVVQGSRSLTVRQDHQQWSGRIDRSDPKTDRCIIIVPTANFTPIAGVRPYESLEVGESAYTLGSPVGLELTLANGIVSGRREEGGRRYVQTTAPISPGSSGGGLFDGQGNLIGITTLAIVGKERLNQALNFAIPADAFWK